MAAADQHAYHENDDADRCSDPIGGLVRWLIPSPMDEAKNEPTTEYLESSVSSPLMTWRMPCRACPVDRTCLYGTDATYSREP